MEMTHHSEFYPSSAVSEPWHDSNMKFVPAPLVAFSSHKRDLASNGLAALPEGVFQNLTALTTL